MKIFAFPLTIGLALAPSAALAEQWVQLAEGPAMTVSIDLGSVQHGVNQHGVEATLGYLLLQLPDGQTRTGSFVADCTNQALYEVTGAGGQGNAIESGEGTIGAAVLARMCEMR